MPRRVGKTYLLLSVLGPLTALGLARHFSLGVAGTAVTVVLGLAPAYLAWAAYRADRAEADPVDLGKVVDNLAIAVKNQWDSEVEVRRVNDPYPLPVAWRAAEASLTEDWPLLTDLARAWPGGPPGDPTLWPSDDSGLAGQGPEISEVFSVRVPTRRLVVLGEPGAGKSVLLIRLLQDLIARRADGGAVPVLFSLASWNPNQPLKAWMAGELRRTYPGLTGAAPALAYPSDATNDEPFDLAVDLLNRGLILPLFDGFDELPPARHALALDMLNRGLPARQPLVLTCRTDPYRAALNQPGTTVRLNGAAAIQLLPLDAEAAADYLRRDAGGHHTAAADRWSTAITHLGTTSPVGQALTTPLGLFLARTIYNPRPGAVIGSPPVPHPDELCDARAYPDHLTISTHLFRAFIPAAYTPYQSRPPRWTAAEAQEAFVFFAEFLQRQRAGSPDLAWWELPRAIPRHIRGLVVGLTFGIMVGFVNALGFWLAFGPTFGLASGLATGLAFGLTAGLVAALVFGAAAMRADSAAPGIGLDWRGLTTGLATGLTVALTVGLTVGLIFGLTTGLTAGLVFGLIVGLMVTLEGVADLTASFGPVTVFALDRRNFLMIWSMFGFGTCFMVAGAAGLVVGPAAGYGFGLAIGFLYGSGLALFETAWGYLAVVRVYLTVRHNIPWNLMAFLLDAHQRGVLRQVGPVYQFRHIDLQRHLVQ